MTQAVDITGELPGESFDLHILKPGTSSPLGWIITLCGPEHQKAVAYADVRRREQLHRESQQEAAQVNGRKYKPDELTPAEAELKTLLWVDSRILNWTPIKIGDEVFEYSQENVIKVFKRPAMSGYLTQVVDYLRSERAFMPRSATS